VALQHSAGAGLQSAPGAVAKHEQPTEAEAPTTGLLSFRQLPDPRRRRPEVPSVEPVAELPASTPAETNLCRLCALPSEVTQTIDPKKDYKDKVAKVDLG
jgi:hypothetical protein